MQRPCVHIACGKSPGVIKEKRRLSFSVADFTCARFWTHISIARSDGRPESGSIWRTLRHLAKRAPCAYASAQRFSRSSMPLHHVSAWPSGPLAVPGRPALS